MPMDPVIRFFNPYELILRHGERLPHWQQTGASYFLTFRLADSIPQTQLKIWEEERADWLLRHRGPSSEEVEVEYQRLFSGRVDPHLDAGTGACILRKPGAAGVVSEVLLAGNGERFVIHCFVVMPNHVHLAVTLGDGESLPRLVKIWKGVSSRRIGRQLRIEGRLWQRDYFDRIIRDEDHFFRVVRYIRANPAKAGLSADGFLLWESDAVRRILDV